MATPKLERLLNLVAELIQTDRPLPAQELRARLGVYPEDDESFKRAFERDKEDLREMNIPIEIETDPHSGTAGYHIDRDTYGLPDPELEADERAALHLAAAAVRLDGTDITPGMYKLGGVAPNPSSVPDEMAVLPSDPLLGPLLDAVSAQRRLRFRHRGKDRTADPFQLLVDGGHWYLRVYDVDADALRSYRIDRIEGEIEAGEPSSVAHTVDPAEHPVSLAPWALGDGPPVMTTLRVSPAKRDIAGVLVGDDGDLDEREDGSLVVTLPVTHFEGLRGWVLSFLGDVEILAPADYRDAVVDWLEAMATAGSV